MPAPGAVSGHRQGGQVEVSPVLGCWELELLTLTIRNIVLCICRRVAHHVVVGLYAVRCSVCTEEKEIEASRSK